MALPKFLMKLWRQITARLFGSRNSPGVSGPISVVLLLKHPSFWSGQELATAVTRAFDVPFSTENPEQFVTSRNDRAVLYIKPHLVSVFAASRPYLSHDPREFAKSLPEIDLQQAWANHKGWAAIDYLRGGANVGAEYGVLSKIAVELINDNCSGIFIPREGLLFPNNEVLPQRLQGISSG